MYFVLVSGTTRLSEAILYSVWTGGTVAYFVFIILFYVINIFTVLCIE